MSADKLPLYRKEAVIKCDYDKLTDKVVLELSSQQKVDLRAYLNETHVKELFSKSIFGSDLLCSFHRICVHVNHSKVQLASKVHMYTPRIML